MGASGDRAGFPRSFGADFFGPSGSRTSSSAQKAAGAATSPGEAVIPLMPAPVLPVAPPISAPPRSNQAQAGGSLLLPDIPNPDNGQWAADCGAYAFDKVCGYAAAVCFLGKVAGVVGTDEEIEQARSLIKSAFAEIGNILYGGSDDIQALRAEQRQLEEEIYRHHHLGGMLGPTAMDRTSEAMEAFHHAYKGAMETGDLSAIDSLRQVKRTALFAGDVPVFRDAYIDNIKGEIVARRRLEEVKHKRRLLGDRDVGDVIGDYFKGLWDDIKKIYNELEENIRNGRWKYGLCKAFIDGEFLFVETAASLAIVPILTALGLAAAGVMMRIATMVVADGVKTARRLSEVRHIRINLTFTRQHARGQPFDVDGPQQVSRNTDIKPHELTDGHKKLLDERYQGNLDATPDAHQPPAPKKEAAKPAGKKPDFSRISEKEKQLARTAGNSKEQQKARKKIVTVFAEETGIPDNKLKNMIGDGGGIDLEQPLEIKQFKKGDRLTQWYDPTSPHGPGNWVDPTGNQHPSSLGISPEGRVQQVFIMEKDGYAIESIAKGVTDTWTNKAHPYKAKGEGTQWFIPDQYKPTLAERLGNPIKTWREIPFEID